MRLTHSGRDLSGFGGRLIGVTKAEVKKHNTKDDCWYVMDEQWGDVLVADTQSYSRMIFKHRVYNITPYVHFHPGGVDMILKAAGKDGTSLINKYHPW